MTMYQLGEKIYANFRLEDIKKTKIQKVRSLIMGHVGNGKTQFINNMCNTNYKVGATRGSLTRDIAFQDVVYLPRSRFRIYDTPGSNSSQDALQHALILRASLTNLPLNMIFIQAKFSVRYQQTFAQFAQQIRIFDKFESLVVFLVSHADQLEKQKNKQEILEDIGKIMQQYEFSNRLVIYSNQEKEGSNFEVLSKILYNIGKQNQAKKIQIEDEKFYKYFKLSSSIMGLKTKTIDKYIDQIKSASSVFEKFATELKVEQGQDINQLAAQLKCFMKYYLKELQYKQYQIYEKGFNDDNKTTNLYLMISQYIQTTLEKVDEELDYKLPKVIYVDSYQKHIDIYQLFKACPHCGVIWMKVKGCDGDTTCGYKSYYYDYDRNRDFYIYQFSIIDNKLTYKRKKQMKIVDKIQQSKLSQQQFFNFNIKIQQKNIGCGGFMIWKNLPKIIGIQKMLKQMFKGSNFQQIQLEIMKIFQGRRQYKKKLEQKVNTTIQIMKKDQISF